MLPVQEAKSQCWIEALHNMPYKKERAEQKGSPEKPEGTMTPLECAEILESWAAKAKIDESRTVCEMAAIGMRNAAKSRGIVGDTGELTIQYIRDTEARCSS